MRLIIIIIIAKNKISYAESKPHSFCPSFDRFSYKIAIKFHARLNCLRTPMNLLPKNKLNILMVLILPQMHTFTRTHTHRLSMWDNEIKQCLFVQEPIIRIHNPIASKAFNDNN